MRLRGPFISATETQRKDYLSRHGRHSNTFKWIESAQMDEWQNRDGKKALKNFPGERCVSVAKK